MVFYSGARPWKTTVFLSSRFPLSNSFFCLSPPFALLSSICDSFCPLCFLGSSSSDEPPESKKEKGSKLQFRWWEVTQKAGPMRAERLLLPITTQLFGERSVISLCWGNLLSKQHIKGFTAARLISVIHELRMKPHAKAAMRGQTLNSACRHLRWPSIRLPAHDVCRNMSVESTCRSTTKTT